MKNLFLIISVVCFQFYTNAQTFQSAIGGFASDLGRSIVKTSDGGYAIAGSTYSYGIDSSDVYVVKFSSTGAVQWTATIGGSSYDAGACIIQTADGGYAITGRTGYWTFEVYTIKLSALGNLQWTSKVSNGSSDQGYSIIQTNDGGYAIAARTSIQLNYLGYIIKLNNNGVVQWTKTLSNFFDGIYSIVQTPDLGYVVAGATTASGAGNSDIFIVKLDAAGSIQWTRTVGGGGEDQLFPSANIIKTNDGGFAIAGFTNSFGAGTNDVYVIKLNSMGNLQWTRTVGGSNDDMGVAITQTSDNGYAIAGSSVSFGAGNYDAYIVKLDSAGTLQWTRTTGGSSGDAAYSIIQTNDGGYVFTGTTSSFGSGNGDVYLVKLDANGNTCGINFNGGTASLGGVAGSGTCIAGNITSVASTGGSSGLGGVSSVICSCTPPTASISPSGNLSFCTGAGITLQANTGAGLTYQWRKNSVNIAGATSSSYLANSTGTFNVVVTNVSGCSKGATPVSVTSPPSNTVSANGSTNFCTGGSVTLTSSSGQTVTYQWRKNGANIAGATAATYAATSTGSYNCVVTNSFGCSKGGTPLSVTGPPSAVITANGPTTFCAGGSVQLSAQGGYTYQWIKNSANIAGATQQNYVATTPGNYKVKVTNQFGCSKTTPNSNQIVVSVPCRVAGTISDTVVREEVIVFPNPFTDELTVAGLEFTVGDRIQMMNVLGEVVFDQTISTSTEYWKLKTSNIPSGIYFMQVTTPAEKKTVKVVRR